MILKFKFLIKIIKIYYLFLFSLLFLNISSTFSSSSIKSSELKSDKAKIDFKVNFSNFQFKNLENFALSKEEIEELRILWSEEDLRLEKLGYSKYNKIRIGEQNLKEKPYPADYIHDPILRKYVEDLIIQEQIALKKKLKDDEKTFEQKLAEFIKQLKMLYYAFGSFACYGISTLFIISWFFLSFVGVGSTGKWIFLSSGYNIKSSYIILLIWKFFDWIWKLGVILNFWIIPWYGLIYLIFKVMLFIFGGLVITFILPLYNYFIRRFIKFLKINLLIYFRKFLYYYIKRLIKYLVSTRLFKKCDFIYQKIKKYFLIKLVKFLVIIKNYFSLRFFSLNLALKKKIYIKKHARLKIFNDLTKNYYIIKILIYFFFLIKNFYYFLIQISFWKKIKFFIFKFFYFLNNKLFLLVKKILFIYQKFFGKYGFFRKVNFFFKKRFKYYYYLKLKKKIFNIFIYNYWKDLDEKFSIILKFENLLIKISFKLNWFLKNKKFYKKIFSYIDYFFYLLLLYHLMFWYIWIPYSNYIQWLDHPLSQIIYDISTLLIALLFTIVRWSINKSNTNINNNTNKLTQNFWNKFLQESFIFGHRFIFFYFTYMCCLWPHFLLMNDVHHDDFGKEIKVDIILNTNIISYFKKPIYILYVYGFYCLLFTTIIYLVFWIFYYLFIAQEPYKKRYIDWNFSFFFNFLKKSYTLIYFRFLKVEDFTLRFFRRQHKLWDMTFEKKLIDDSLNYYIKNYINYHKIDESLSGKIIPLSFNNEKGTKALLKFFDSDKKIIDNNFIYYDQLSLFLEMNWLKNYSFPNEKPDLSYNKLLDKRYLLSYKYEKITNLKKGHSYLVENPEIFLWMDDKYYNKKKFYKFLVRERNSFWSKDYFFHLLDRHFLVKNNLLNYYKFNQLGLYLTIFIIPFFIIFFYKLFFLILWIIKIFTPYLKWIWNFFF